MKLKLTVVRFAAFVSLVTTLLLYFAYSKFSAHGISKAAAPAFDKVTVARPAFDESTPTPTGTVCWKCRNSTTFCNYEFKAWKDGLLTMLKPEIPRDCAKIIGGDPKEINRTRALNAKWKSSVSDQDFLNFTRNCSWVKEYFRNTLYVTRLERSFPIAFSLIAHNSPQQIVRFLKVIFRSHNHYCIHYDLKSDSVFEGIFKNIARCMSNVHLASRVYGVTWGEPTIMEAQMQCLRDLVHIREKLPDKDKWKYVINLCGKELPLATNHEIVSRLVRLNETSVIGAHEVNEDDREMRRRLQNKKIPFNLSLYKSMTYMAISYPFAHFLFSNSTAIALHDFFKKTKNSEEHFYSTLFKILGVPGGYNPNLPRKDYFMINNAFWIHGNKRDCFGQVIHRICIVTCGDLKKVLRGQQLFHNKYYTEDDHTVMDCIEERIIAKNKLEFQEDCSESSG